MNTTSMKNFVWITFFIFLLIALPYFTYLRGENNAKKQAFNEMVDIYRKGKQGDVDAAELFKSMKSYKNFKENGVLKSALDMIVE